MAEDNRMGAPAPQMDALLDALLERAQARGEPQISAVGASAGAARMPVRRIGGDRRRPPLRLRRSAQRASAALETYQRSRAAVGLAIVALIFLSAWLLNGHFTAQMVMRWGGTRGWGWGAHLIITATELTMVFVTPYLRAIGAPVWLYVLIWAIVLPFGIFDTSSSALGFLSWAGTLGLVWNTTTISLATLLAEAIAFVPEPALFWLAQAFAHLLNER